MRQHATSIQAGTLAKCGVMVVDGKAGNTTLRLQKRTARTHPKTWTAACPPPPHTRTSVCLCTQGWYVQTKQPTQPVTSECAPSCACVVSNEVASPVCIIHTSDGAPPACLSHTTPHPGISPHTHKSNQGGLGVCTEDGYRETSQVHSIARRRITRSKTSSKAANAAANAAAAACGGPRCPRALNIPQIIPKQSLPTCLPACPPHKCVWGAWP